MIRKKKVYYCKQCQRWCGMSKECPECEIKTEERELPSQRGNYYFIDGIDKPLPRVTNILKVLAKPGLAFWQTRIAVQAALEDPSLSVSEAIAATYKKRDKAGNTGSDVHKIIQEISKGRRIDERVNDIPQIQAYRKFCQAVTHQVLESELVIYSKKFEYAGTLDALIQTYSTAIVEGQEKVEQAKGVGYEIIKEVGPLALMRKNNGIWLVDYKSGNGVYKESFLQLSAYKHALIEMRPEIKIDGLSVIHLEKDGSFNFIEVKDCFDVFRSVLKLFSWTK